MTTYTKDDREFLEVQLQKQTLQTGIDEPKDTPDPGPESVLLSKCTDYLKRHHYRYFHDYSQRINKAGFLDLYIFLPKKRLVIIELKSGTGGLSDEQKETVSYLLYHGYEVHQNVQSYHKFLEIMYGRD